MRKIIRGLWGAFNAFRCSNFLLMFQVIRVLRLIEA
jgi:hypothetical protein